MFSRVLLALLPVVDPRPVTHTDRCRVTPYLWSYHRSNLFVPNPLESMAKHVSTVRSGAALAAMSRLRIGVNAGFSMKAQTFMPGIFLETCPRRCDSL